MGIKKIGNNDNNDGKFDNTSVVISSSRRFLWWSNH